MVSVTIRDREMRPGERAHIRGEMIFGYKETLNPSDVELKTIETLQFTPKVAAGTASKYEPAGSIANPGNIGNSATLVWLIGSSGPETGSIATGSRSAYFDIIGG